MGIGWGDLGDPSQLGTKKELKEALIEAYEGENPKNDTDSIWSFVHDVRPGDVIWARRGTKHVVGYGIVKSDFKYEPERKPYQSIRDVEWIDMEEFDVEGTFNQRTLYELHGKDLGENKRARCICPREPWLMMTMPGGPATRSTHQD